MKQYVIAWFHSFAFTHNIHWCKTELSKITSANHNQIKTKTLCRCRVMLGKFFVETYAINSVINVWHVIHHGSNNNSIRTEWWTSSHTNYIICSREFYAVIFFSQFLGISFSKNKNKKKNEVEIISNENAQRSWKQTKFLFVYCIELQTKVSAFIYWATVILLLCRSLLFSLAVFLLLLLFTSKQIYLSLFLEFDCISHVMPA